MTEQRRDSFTSSFGVTMAMVGSAVGLGNIWRFPYMMGENGGGAFILIYLVAALLLSMPIMICEFVIGRRSQVNAVQSFSRLAPGTRWNLTGILAVLTVSIILSFYSVIGGWSINYFIKSLTFSLVSTPDADYAGIFAQSVGSVWSPLFYTALFYGLTALIVSFGIKNGVEKCSRVMMPVLFVLIVAIAVRSMTLPGAAAGIKYIFKPDFSQVTGRTVASAMGQAFFSLSVGVGTIITYASYVSRKENILKCSARTVISDTLFAVIAGCAIMPAVFAFGYNPGEGPGLVFITLPGLFANMSFGGIIAVVFFFALLLAALSSSISMIEVIVSFLTQKFHISRRKAIAFISVYALAVAALCSLSQGPLADVKVMGKDILSFLDYISATFMMTLGAILFVIFVGWKLGREVFVSEMTSEGSVRVPSWLLKVIFFIIKFIAPPVIIGIIAFSIIG